MKQYGIVSIFPEMFMALDYGITGRARQQQLIAYHYYNPRDYSQDRHLRVDDRPYGGGPGMVMCAQPLTAAITAAKAAMGPTTKVIQLSPQGQRLDHSAVHMLAAREQMIFVAGRYEGIDERVVAATIDEQWSIGDYVISGGELAIMVLLDAMIRQIPGALGDTDSALQDSFVDGLLDHPHYTRPEEFNGKKVPEILMKGDHQAIKRWRAQQALGRTWQLRPDLLQHKTLTKEQQQLLNEFKLGDSHERE